MSKFNLSDLNNSLSIKYDLLLCSASFEDRCLSIPLVINKDLVRNTLVFYNADQKGKIEENSIKIKNQFETSERIAIHSDNPVVVITEINNVLSKNFALNTGIVNILIDITTFTHETLLILYRLLISAKDKVKISICYVSAKEYSYNVESIKDKWLTKGVGDVRTIIGYPGYSNPSRKTHLIILFGFEVERTQRIIEKFEADIVSIGFPTEESSVSSSHYYINKERHMQLLKNNASLNSFNISLIDPFVTKNALINHISKYNDANTIIAAMNTKISTIGAALAFEVNPDIQLCYVKANLYNTEGYSIAGDTVHFFDI